MSEFTPALLGALGALIAATVAQLMARNSAKNIAEKEWESKVYQEFIFPFLPKVILYYETETHFRKDDHVEKELSLKDLISDISKEVRYGNMKLLSCFYEIEKNRHLIDFVGGIEQRNMLKFLFWYLDYAISILEKMEPKEESLIKEIKEIQKLYGAWIMVTDAFGFITSYNVISFMKQAHLFKDILLSDDINLIREYVEADVGYDERRNVYLSRFVRAIEAKAGDDNLVFIKIFEEYIL